MSRSVEEIEAELEAAKLGEQLIAAKEAGDVPTELKDQLRDARRRHRELREATGAAPGTIAVTADTNDAGA